MIATQCAVQRRRKVEMIGMARGEELPEKSEWFVFDITSKMNHNLLNIVTKMQSRVLRRQKK